MELESIAKKGKEIKLKKETLDFYKKFIEETTRVVYSSIDVDELKKGTQVYDFEGVIDLKDFFINELGFSLPGIKSDLVSEEQKRLHNLICVGGPIPNEITRELLPKGEMVYRLKDHNIVEVSNNKQICGFDKVFDEDEIPKEDHGIITRMKNPYNPKKDAVILCGCLGWGTKACINVLLDEENMRQLKQHRYFQVLVICNIDAKGVVHSARLVENSLKAINY